MWTAGLAAPPAHCPGRNAPAPRTQSIELDYKFSPSGIYFQPNVSRHEEYVSYIEKLPIITDPEVFGLFQTANTVIGKDQGFEILRNLDQIQPSGTGDALGSSEDSLKHQINEIQSLLPTPFKIDVVKEKYPLTYDNTMNAVLIQELQLYNNLISIVRVDVQDLTNALNGYQVLTQKLDQIINNLQNKQVTAHSHPHFSSAAAAAVACQRPSTWHCLPRSLGDLYSASRTAPLRLVLVALSHLVM